MVTGEIMLKLTSKFCVQTVMHLLQPIKGQIKADETEENTNRVIDCYGDISVVVTPQIVNLVSPDRNRYVTPFWGYSLVAKPIAVYDMSGVRFSVSSPFL